MMAGTVCDPGRPRLEGTDGADGDSWPDAAHDPTQPRPEPWPPPGPWHAFPGGVATGLPTKNREVVPLGKVKRQDTFLQEPQQAARSRGCSYSWFCRTGQDEKGLSHVPTSTRLPSLLSEVSEPKAHRRPPAERELPGSHLRQEVHPYIFLKPPSQLFLDLAPGDEEHFQPFQRQHGW